MTPDWKTYYLINDGRAVHKDDTHSMQVANTANIFRVELLYGPRMDEDKRGYSAIAVDSDNNFYTIRWNVVPVFAEAPTVGQWELIK